MSPNPGDVPSAAGADSAAAAQRVPASRPWLRPVRAAGSLTLGVLLVVLALPRVAHSSWSQIGRVLAQLTPGQVILLGAVWLAGLAAYTWVLTAGLPGLSHGQALTLNVTGSAVSNIVPFGGAAGVTVNYAMARSWGFRGPAFALCTVVTGIWNLMAKLALPVVGVLALLVTDEVPDPRLVGAAAIGAVILALGLAAVASALAGERAALLVGSFAEACLHGGLRLARSRHRPRISEHVVDLRRRTLSLVRTRWRSLTAGLLGFLAAQALLQWLALDLLGSTLTVAEVFAGFTLGRLLSSAVITPAGVGISETGVTALLVAFGGDPTVSASGVLLFSGFAYLLEIAAGAVGYLVWLVRRSWRHPVTS